MQLFDSVQQYIVAHNLIPDGSTIIIGLSGGPDSIFLLHLLATLRDKKNLTLIAAHLDHEWRPESGNDVKFCRQASAALGVELVVARASDLAISAKFDGSLEELGRRMRRHFLEAVAQEHGADYIALAHHLQDQEETFFIRLIRGTTLTGLVSMRAQHGKYIRPLLETNKSDIVAYLDQHKIKYIIDPSNKSPKFLRNRIRKNVIPALRLCDTRFDKNFLQTLTKLKQAEAELAQLTQNNYQDISELKSGNTQININKLFKFSPYMQKRIIMHWLIQSNVVFSPQEPFLDEIVKFLSSPTGGTHKLHTTWHIKKKKSLASIENI